MAARGRFIGMMGETFIGTDHGSVAPAGQPTMVRMQGIPTMPGYRDRPEKWNMTDAGELLRWLTRRVKTLLTEATVGRDLSR